MPISFIRFIIEFFFIIYKFDLVNIDILFIKSGQLREFDLRKSKTSIILQWNKYIIHDIYVHENTLFFNNNLKVETCIMNIMYFSGIVRKNYLVYIHPSDGIHSYSSYPLACECMNWEGREGWVRK
jgi:hypothetical protein